MPKCEQQMTIILREAALNYHLNPLLATMCAREVIILCLFFSNTTNIKFVNYICLDRNNMSQ